MIVLGQKLKDAVAHKPDVVPGVEKEKTGEQIFFLTADFALLVFFF